METDERGQLHEYARQCGLKTRTLTPGDGPKFIEIRHSRVGELDNDGSDQQQLKYWSDLAVSMGLNRDWESEINPHWESELVMYDTQHWIAIFMGLANTKTTQLIKYFGTRVSQCLFRLLVDNEVILTHLSSDSSLTHPSLTHPSLICRGRPTKIDGYSIYPRRGTGPKDKSISYLGRIGEKDADTSDPIQNR